MDSLPVEENQDDEYYDYYKEVDEKIEAQRREYEEEKARNRVALRELIDSLTIGEHYHIIWYSNDCKTDPCVELEGYLCSIKWVPRPSHILGYFVDIDGKMPYVEFTPARYRHYGHSLLDDYSIGPMEPGNWHTDQQYGPFRSILHPQQGITVTPTVGPAEQAMFLYKNAADDDM